MQALPKQSANKPWRLALIAVSLTLWLNTGWTADEVPGKNVEELLAYAREHNPDLRVRRLDAAAMRERVVPASALPDPGFQVELMDFTNAMTTGKSASLVPGDVGTTRYRASQALPFPGKRGLRGEVAAALADQALSDHDLARLDLEAKIKIAYARYFQAAGQTSILGETLHLVDALERLVLVRYSVGLVPQQDALRAQSERTSLKLDLVDSERRRRTAAARLNALLPRPADATLATPLRLSAIPGQLALTALYEKARQLSPELNRERLGVTAAEKSKELTWLNRYPDFSLVLTNNQPRNGADNWDFMVGVNIPLQQSSRRAQEREAEARLSAAGERVNAAEARLNGRLGEALAELEASADKARLLRETLLPQARATLDAAQAGYESGRVNFNTLIEAERQILRTRLALLDAEVDASVRQAELEQMIGAPL
ncbi:MAG: transporter [Betaproteobacteria bacterium HGW-Betaproteobacteria-10]|nr:MAG: transporter [Betaproteobacteria bacterium HGW-Betaproteobacteria-10]